MLSAIQHPGVGLRRIAAYRGRIRCVLKPPWRVLKPPSTPPRASPTPTPGIPSWV